MVQSIVLTGPTAVGKTSIALEFASKIGIEIINADSVCFYRGFDIGSAKPSPKEQNLVPHHLLDVADPEESYHAGRFWKECNKALLEIHARGKRAILVGGSGFYLKALRFGLWDAPASSPEFRETLSGVSTHELHSRLVSSDPDQAKKIMPADRYRIIRALEILALSGRKPSELESEMPTEPDPRFRLWVLDREKMDLELRIRERVCSMIDAGWIDETARLRTLFPGARALSAVGYRQIIDHLDGNPPQGRKPEPGLAGLVEEITLAHRKLAKQQRTWFKNMGSDRRFLLDRDLADLKDSLMRFYQ
ncbi:MAG: tRNA (adenosine(37)-N6)-dimethylallyltransferase MiaA [Bdellovibrionales bacterium]|nr:tRNA (adenosine(37)-N6)-dimethylallyltransferase MiaA [Bdellovibrionales bacterium]